MVSRILGRARQSFWRACLVLVMSHVALGDEPGFAKLAHKSRPLVQEGSGNLLPSPGFKDGLKGWETWGDVTLVGSEGEPRLRFGPKKGEETARIRVYIPKPKGGVMYRLRFEVKMKPEVEFDWGATNPGLTGWLSHGVAGKSPIGPVAIRETRRSEQWQPREFRLFSHPKTQSLYISLGFGALRGEALTRRWELAEERIQLRNLPQRQTGLPSRQNLWVGAN